VGFPRLFVLCWTQVDRERWSGTAEYLFTLPTEMDGDEGLCIQWTRWTYDVIPYSPQTQPRSTLAERSAQVKTIRSISLWTQPPWWTRRWIKIRATVEMEMQGGIRLSVLARCILIRSSRTYFSIHTLAISHLSRILSGYILTTTSPSLPLPFDSFRHKIPTAPRRMCRRMLWRQLVS
jgi:hypothetical protein